MQPHERPNKRNRSNRQRSRSQATGERKGRRRRKRGKRPSGYELHPFFVYVLGSLIVTLVACPIALVIDGRRGGGVALLITAAIPWGALILYFVFTAPERVRQALDVDMGHYLLYDQLIGTLLNAIGSVFGLIVKAHLIAYGGMMSPAGIRPTVSSRVKTGHGFAG